MDGGTKAFRVLDELAGFYPIMFEQPKPLLSSLNFSIDIGPCTLY